MSDFNTPALSTAYSTFLTALKDRDVDTATMFDSGSPTNVPTDAIKFSKSAGVFQKWTGAAWSTVQIQTAAIANNAITTALIADTNVTGAKLASGAAAGNLGFTPANKAGDTFTGAISVSANAPQVSFIESDNSNKTWLMYLNAGVFGIYEDTTANARVTIAVGASTLALGAAGSITYNGQSVWHAGNDGAASGLDADMVDGQHLGTGATAQFAALGLGGANDGSQAAYIVSTGMLANLARQGVEIVASNAVQTLTANRLHHGILSSFSNVHFDGSGFTLGAYGADVSAINGGVGTSAKAAELIGGVFTASNATDQATNNTVVTGIGVKAVLKSTNANALITTGYGAWIEVNAASAGAITTAWLGYFSYTGTAPTTKHGLRVVGEDWSQFDGSLGLGIQPTQKLHVSGNALLTGTVTVGSQVFGGGSQGAGAPDFAFVGDAVSGLRRTAANTIALVTNSTDRLTVGSTGLVGINTAPATYQLSVGGSFNATSLFENGVAFTSTYARLAAANAYTVGGHSISVGAAVTVAESYISTDAGAADWPALIIDRQSSSPAASDILSSIVFAGKNSGAAQKYYAAIQTEIIDATAASEDGKIAFRTMVAGTDASRAYIAQGVVIGSPTGTDKGTGSINAQTIYWNGTSLAGKQTLILSWSAFWARATNPAGSATFESATNKINYKGWAFDPATAEYIQTVFTMPKSWDKGTLTVTVRGFRHTGSGTSAARFESTAAIIDSGDAADIALGAAVGVTVTPNTTSDIQWEGVMSGVTPSGTTSSANSTLILQIRRNPADAADADATNDFIITDVLVTFGTSAPTDD